MNATAVGLSREYEQQRYTDPYNILRSELIYGDGFQSPGGVAGFRATLADRMPIANGMELLDIGSGLGGAVFDLASRFSVQITGIDTAPVMTQLASKRQSALDPDGHTYFVTGDVYSTELHPDNFDIVYSRDVLMYESDKLSVFRRCHALLKQGGHICITDFCRGRSSSEFEEYITISGYDLRSIADYAALLKEAGFSVLLTENLSSVALRHLVDDLDKYRDRLASGDPAISADDADHIVQRWNRKIRFLQEGCLTQGLFVAWKAAPKELAATEEV